MRKLCNICSFNSVEVLPPKYCRRWTSRLTSFSTRVTLLNIGVSSIPPLIEALNRSLPTKSSLICRAASGCLCAHMRNVGCRKAQKAVHRSNTPVKCNLVISTQHLRMNDPRGEQGEKMIVAFVGVGPASRSRALLIKLCSESGVPRSHSRCSRIS